MMRSLLLALAYAAVPVFAGTAAAQWVEDECTAIHTITGENGGDQHGWVANGIGDVTGDGLPDFVSTAPTNDGNGTNSGRIYVYDGASGAEIWRATGDVAFTRLGADGDGTGGDVSGDDIPDVIAGAPSTGTGRAFVYSGEDGSLIHTLTGENAGDQFGFATTGGGDLNRDGIVDLLVTAPSHDANGGNSGRAYVFSGADFSLICTFDGLNAGDSLGSSAAFVGDLNNDDRDEFVVGANAAGGSGRAYVVSYDGQNCSILHTLQPQGAAVGFGLFFSDGGRDVDGDSVPDIYVSDFQANRAHVFSGADGSLIWELDGEGEGGQFGIGRIIPDIDGDSHADLVLAAWISGRGAGSAGKAFLYSGSTGEVIRTMTYTVPNAGFGFDAAGLGDVNEDGAFDFLITAASEAGSTGKTFVMAGVPDSEVATLLNVNVVEGTHNGGGVAELVASDDQYYATSHRVTGEAAEAHRLQYILQAETSLTQGDEFTITIEGRTGDPESVVTVFLMDWGVGFEQVAQFGQGLTDSTEVFVVPNANQYSRNSNGRIEMLVKKHIILPSALGGTPSFDDLIEIDVSGD